MTKRLHTAETLGVPSDAKREDKIGKKNRGLDYLLLGVIDETLKQVFKEEGAKVIYKYVENKCHLKWEQIFENPEVFSAGLERLLVSAAPVIEKMIVKSLYSKLELNFEEKKGYEFSDYIRELREKLDVEG